MEKAFEELTAAVAGGVPMCGCGRPVRYIVSNGDGTADSCNKYMRCPTWDELHEQNMELSTEQILTLLDGAITSGDNDRIAAMLEELRSKSV
jgi:hypothetical protein